MEEKVRLFGGLTDLEQEFLKDINHNNQRLDNVLNSVRTLVKMDSKTKRNGVSPIGKSSVKRVV